MRENSGIIVEITEGVHKGQYGIARNNKQHEPFKKINKLFIELYEDRLAQKRVMDGGKKVVTLIQISYCKLIGYVD